MTIERRELRGALREMFTRLSAERDAADWDTPGGDRADAVWCEIVDAGLIDLAEAGTAASTIDEAIVLSACGQAGLAQPVGGAMLALSLRAAGLIDDRVADGIAAGERVCIVDSRRGEGSFASTAEHFLVLELDSVRVVGPDDVVVGAPRGADAARDVRAVTVRPPTPPRVSTGVDLDESRLRAELYEAAELIGVLDSILEQTLSFLGQRKQFNRPIGSFQAIKHGIVDATAQLESARALVFRAARLIEDGATDRKHAMRAATSRLAMASRDLCGKAFQYHGAIAHTWELELHRWITRAIALQSSLSEVETSRRAVGAALLADPGWAQVGG